MLARACAVARVALLVLLLHQASAAFYSKGSDVVAISDAAGLKRLQRSNYLWVLEFYREGCGYCVQAAPEYEKAATSLKRMVGFAAVDVEKNQGIAGQLMQAFGVEVKGVPTIVMLKPTSKGMTKVERVHPSPSALSLLPPTLTHLTHLPPLPRRLITRASAPPPPSRPPPSSTCPATP